MRVEDRGVLVSQAQRSALAAAGRAGVAVSDELETDEFRAAASLFATVWRTRGMQAPVTAELMRAFALEGNYVSAAYREARMVGASVGFLYRGNGSLGLHSHITGVLEGEQGRSAGFALKQHQRAWSLARGIEIARWTYDPLVRRNAYFNITKLGADVAAFLPNFYGEMSDGVNAGDDTDRCLVEWRLTTDRVAAASDGSTFEPGMDALAARGATVILDEDEAGRPVPRPQAGNVRLCRVPADAVALRASDPDLARAWRFALREALGGALDDGLRATGFARTGWYVLETA